MHSFRVAATICLVALTCLTARADERGQSLFELNCVACHGMGGTGGRGPNLARPRLSHAPDDRALHDVIANGIPPEMPPGYFFMEDEIADLVVYVRSLGKVVGKRVSGNSGNGRKIFAENGCTSCHIFKGEGVGFGPELTDVGERRSPAYLGETILDPASHLIPDFQMIKVVTDGGDALEGIRVNEDSFSIQIKDTAGRYHSLEKARLKSFDRLVDQTPMPAFKGVLTSAQIKDLIAYLETGADAR